MSVESIKLAITFLAVRRITFVRLYLDVNFRVASQMRFANKSFIAIRARKGFVISLLKISVKLNTWIF